MAVSSGTTALASAYNTLRTAVNLWFADNYAGSISFGNGNQTYGWGGTAAPTVSTGNQMLASQMNALVDRCNVGEDICNVVSGQLSQVVAGNQILATDYNNIETKSTSINTNRLDIEAAEMSVTASGNTARTTAWASQIDATFRFTFASFDRARYFFNSGGAIQLYGTISGYSTGTGQDGQAFYEIFNAMGTITMNYTQTTQSGSGGTPTSLGYYDLTTAYQNIFGQTGVGAYTDAYVYVDARRSATGDYVEIRIRMIPGVGRSVNGTTTIYLSERKLDNQSSGAVSLTVTAPTYSLIDGL